MDLRLGFRTVMGLGVVTRIWKWALGLRIEPGFLGLGFRTRLMDSDFGFGTQGIPALI